MGCARVIGEIFILRGGGVHQLTGADQPKMRRTVAVEGRSHLQTIGVQKKIKGLGRHARHPGQAMTPRAAAALRHEKLWRQKPWQEFQ